MEGGGIMARKVAPQVYWPRSSRSERIAKCNDDASANVSRFGNRAPIGRSRPARRRPSGGARSGAFERRPPAGADGRVRERRPLSEPWSSTREQTECSDARL
ncbi:uncharacterized protein LOC111673941 [Orussus abietinus]|uniref:uncharacterized protein LOC111673941 n=1 Tax=Orussus abietinus TaxID=222816 RepID=UPI000C715AF6|nr:uncharacterized protein LOC111673941 [Orussus abietinus]